MTAREKDRPAYVRYSFVYPIHNEAERLHNLAGIIDFFRTRLSEPFEVLLVNNGSTDGTSALARGLVLSYPEVRLIEIERVGRGNALRDGFLAARGDLVGVSAIDRAWDERFFVEAAGLLGPGGVDVVYGPKTHPGSDVHRPLLRGLVSTLSRAFLSLLFAVPLQDTQCIKLFVKRRCPFIQELGPYNYFAETEFFLRARRHGLKATAIPVSVRDTNRGSKVRPSSLGRFLFEAAHFRFSNK